jgi:hypothetical protein
MTEQLNRTPVLGLGQAGQIGPVRQDGWITRIPESVDVPDLGHRFFTMLFVLETLCRDKSYTWATNATLAQRFGCSGRQIQTLLREMEVAGHLWRVLVEPDRPGDGRAGIFLHRRLNPDLPIEDRPPPAEAVQRLWAARRRSQEPVAETCVPPTKKPSYPPRRNLRTPHEETFVQNKDESLKKDELKDDDDGQGGSSSLCQTFIEDELIRRARRLFPAEGDMVQAVQTAVAVYGLAMVRWALNVAEKRPSRKLGNLPVRSWGFVLRSLENRLREFGGAPSEPESVRAPVSIPLTADTSPPEPRLTPSEVSSRIRAMLPPGRRNGLKTLDFQGVSVDCDGEIG